MIRIEKEEIAEMEAMLKHLYFTTNKTKPVRLTMRELIKEYSVKYKNAVGAVMVEKKIISKTGRNSVCYRWESSEEPSKIMARRIIEAAHSKSVLQTKSHRDKKEKVSKTTPKEKLKATAIKESTEKISREEFEKRLEIVNNETGEYNDVLQKVKKESKNKATTTEVKILWGLFSYSKK